MVDTDWRRVAVERLRVIHNLVARLGSAEKQRDEMFLALADLRDAIRNGEDTTKPKPPCDPAVAK
jgi:hypothetical protein